MEIQATEVQTLVSLGLNTTQAKVYFTLAKIGPSNAAAIAKQSKINPSDAQFTLTKLYELGIVEKKSCAEFKAASADQTLKFLLQRKNQPKTGMQLSDLRIDDGSGFVVIPKKVSVIKQALELIDNSRESIDFIVSWKFFSENIHSVPEKINPNVPKRCVIEQPPTREGWELLKKFEDSFFSLRFIPCQPKALMGIFDRKEALMIEDLSMRKLSALWTNNSSMLIMAQNYFESLWSRATLKPSHKRF